MKMKKNLLNEIKAMNRIAGTQLTKEQEIALIKQTLNESSVNDYFKNMQKVKGTSDVYVSTLPFDQEFQRDQLEVLNRRGYLYLGYDYSKGGYGSGDKLVYFVKVNIGGYSKYQKKG